MELFWKASFKIDLDFWDCFRGHFKRDLYISGLFGRASFKMDPDFKDCFGRHLLRWIQTFGTVLESIF